MSSSPTDTALLDVTMPQMGVSVAEGTIVAWRVAVGDTVAADETVVEISTDKIDSEVPSPAAGVVAEILVDVEATVSVGTVLARLAVGATSSAPAELARESAPADSPGPPSSPAGGELAVDAQGPAHATTRAADPAPTNGNGHARYYSPVVQRIASKHGIDLESLEGTGRNGRVRKQDVMAMVSVAAEPPMHIESPYRPEPVPPPALVSPPQPAGGAAELSRMRRQIGEHMKRSLDTAATCTTWNEVDLTRVETQRRAAGVTALAYIARACVLALREFPALNAWLAEDGSYSRFDREVHLGIAVSLGENGLIVPVIHAAHELSVEGLASRIRDLAARARSGALTPDEVRGGTFTITAPGQYGSIMATPIIHQPQVGILDFEAVVKRPVVLTDPDGNDAIAIRSMTILGLSWDHRALDGALSAQFLAAVKRRLEDGA